MHRDRKKEILSDERVQAAQKAGRGGRVRSEEETAAASSVTVVGKSDSRAEASPAQNGSRKGVRISHVKSCVSANRLALAWLRHCAVAFTLCGEPVMVTEHGKGCAEPGWVCKQWATTGRCTRHIRQCARECAERQSMDSRVERAPGHWERPIEYSQFRCGCEERGGDGEQLDDVLVMC